jgi:hypothetical protein
MRLRHTAALGLAAGALLLSGGLAMADSSSGTIEDSAGAAPGSGTTGGPTTGGATTGSTTTESGTSTAAGGSGYGFATADGEGVTSFSVTVPGDDGPDHGKGEVRRMTVNGEDLSDSQRECMERNGAAPPDFQDRRPTREEMEAHRQKVEAAMDECGIEHPGPGEPGRRGPDGPDGPVMIVNGEELSDSQRQCMEENAPAPPAPTGERPSRADMEQNRSAMEAAMDECGIDHPEGGAGGRPGSFEDGTETATATLIAAGQRGA